MDGFLVRFVNEEVLQYLAVVAESVVNMLQLEETGTPRETGKQF